MVEYRYKYKSIINESIKVNYKEDLKMNRIDVVCLGVRDMEASLRFYRDGLGFETEETENDPRVVFFNTQGSKFELYPLDKLAEDIGLSEDEVSPHNFHGMTLAYNTKEKHEVDQIVELVRNAGAIIVKEAQDASWGGYHAYFSDPDGYYWEVAWSHTFTFDENNMLEL